MIKKSLRCLSGSIERLEARIAPASLVKLYQFTDVDGDLVTIKASKAILDEDRMVFLASGDGLQLQTLGLEPGITGSTGASLSITAKPQLLGGILKGDAFVNVGAIEAKDSVLTSVVVHGDLGRIEVGTGAITALSSLTVGSMGRFGLTTQELGKDLLSNFYGNVGTVKVGGDLLGAGLDSIGRISSVTVLGSLVGGAGVDESGVIHGATGLGSVKIGGNLIGSTGLKTGQIVSEGSISSVTVGGSLMGTLGVDESGVISASTGIGAVKIGGSVFGSSGAKSGRISSRGSIASVSIGGSLVGGDGDNSGEIYAKRSISRISITGSVLGGEGDESGHIQTENKNSTNDDTKEDISLLSIKGDVRGGTSPSTGLIECGHSVVNFTIGGSLVGTDHDHTGEIKISKHIDVLRITHDIQGGNAAGTANINYTGFVKADSLKVVLIGGSIKSGIDTSSGTLTNSGAVRTADEIRVMKITGGLIGNVIGDYSPAVISGEDNEFHTANPNSDVGILNLRIGGSVEYGLIQAGYAVDGTLAAGAGGDAKIGTVYIAGDWIASSMVAGVSSTNAYYGDNDDLAESGDFAANYSRINNVTIVGQAYGTLSTLNPSDLYAFTAQKISRISIGGFVLPTTSAMDDFAIGGATGYDLRVKELPLI